VNSSVRVAVLASGRGSNFEALVRAERAGRLGARIVRLVTDDAQAAALQIAAHHAVSALVVDAGPRRGRLAPAAEERILEVLRDDRVDLVCLAGFMRIVGGALLDAWPAAVLNVHPSLLPSFPGLEAPRQALQHGVKVSGCTVHLVDAGVDSGPIVLQASVPVHDDDTPETLAARILEREHDLYPRAVRLWAEGRLRLEGRRVRIEPETQASTRPAAAGTPANGGLT
jgi:phosphoribosylglycinamide formyltransferase-1